jgi:hypothetical protein
MNVCLISLMISVFNVGLTIIILALFTCIIVDNIHYIQQICRIVSWREADFRTTGSTILISGVLVMYNFYDTTPNVPLSYEMFITIISQIFTIIVGMMLHRHTGSLDIKRRVLSSNLPYTHYEPKSDTSMSDQLRSQ